MGLRYVFPKHGLVYPLAICDVCNEPIKDLTKGNVTWTAPSTEWQGHGDWTTDDVFFTHKQCDYTLRQQLRHAGVTSTFWEQLHMFPVHLMYHAGMRPAAKAAFEARVTPVAIEATRHTGLALRFHIFKRDGYRCQICGRTAQNGAVLEVDHKIARAKGGSDNPSNLWTLCFDCNRGKSDDDL